MRKIARSATTWHPAPRDMFAMLSIVLIAWGCEPHTTAPRTLGVKSGERMSTVSVLRPVMDRPAVGDDVYTDWRHMDDPDRDQFYVTGEQYPPPIRPLYPLISDEDTKNTYIKTFAVPGIFNTSFRLTPLPIGRSVSKIRVVSLCAVRTLTAGYTIYLVIGGSRYDIASSKGGTITDLTSNPASGQPWRGGDFAPMRIGIEGSGYVNDTTWQQLICYELYIEVTHEQHPGPAIALIRDLPPELR